MKRKSGRQLIQQGSKTLLKQKQTVITAALLAALLLLLFGIFSQLPAPDPTTSERGTTAINYNTFLAQVRAGNVLVVSLQDQVSRLRTGHGCDVEDIPALLRQALFMQNMAVE